MKIKDRTVRTILVIVVIFVTSALIYSFGNSVSRNFLHSLIVNAGIWAPVVYILLFLVTIILPPLNSMPLLVIGFFLFKNQVQLYVYIASVLGSVVNFLIARKWGREVVIKLVGEKSIGKIDQIAKEYGVDFLIFFRVLQGYLSDFISYAFGLTDIKFSKYLLISLLAPIPYLLVWQFFLIKIAKNVTQYLALHFLLFLFVVMLSSVWVLVKSIRNKAKN